MDPTLLALAALILGLTGGFAAGWWVATRPLAEWRNRHSEQEGQCRELNERLDALLERPGLRQRAHGRQQQGCR